ncbi:MAG: hypothetical protein RLZZ546_358 [Bacteroidota bacterium]|jgi:hypothetical protein
MKIHFINVFICFLALSLQAQTQFVDATSQYQILHSYGKGTAGGGVSFVDFDNNGYDDISLASSEQRPIIFYKNNNGILSKIDLLPGFLEEVKSILWVDFDNDGDKDLFLALANNHNKLFENKGNLSLFDISETSGISLIKNTSFGACWGDYNRDGLLDLYVGERRIQTTGELNVSVLYKNNGNKTFTDVSTSTNSLDAGKTPFCSSFIDYNNDMWPDIYTAHDRNRGNTLLENNNGQNFASVGFEKGCDLKMNGMSVSVADINNDGWQEIYVSNTTEGNALFFNENGNFRNLSDSLGVSFNGVAWGTNFLDADNDGDQDLYVSSMLIGKNMITSSYYENQFPQLKFTKENHAPSDTVSSFNNAIGDINKDGFYDIIVSNSEFPTALFKNTGNSNSFVSIRLKGVLSNRDGIGAKIKAISNGTTQYHYTQCGIGFLGQNSDQILLGLAQNDEVDSIIILWPTGHIDVFTNLQKSKWYEFYEGQSTNNIINVDPSIVLFTQISEIESIGIYPNPASDKLIIKHNQSIDFLSMYNQFGNLVLQDNLKNGEVNISSLKNGMYFIKLIDKNKNYIIKKVIIQK